jgi:tetratricopeptide (TPR) repeat protein
MANVGSVARIALSEVLKTIALNELSGCLEVTSGKKVRTVYFDRGFIVFTASNSEADRLGQLLLDAGKITAKELELAAALMKGNRRIGEAIVAAGYLTEDELGRELANQARRVASSLLALTEGMYRFEEKECPIPLELRLSLSLYRIQLEGIREMKNAPLIVASLPPTTRVLRLSKCPPFSFEDVRFVPLELLVMEAAQKERTIESILERVSRAGQLGKFRARVLRAIYGLFSAGILELAQEAATVKPLKVQEETGTFLLSKLDHEREPEKARNVREEVLLEFENSERASAAELLEVDALASPEEIESAFARRREAWEQKQRNVEREKTLFLKVEEIQRRLERAKAQLLDEKADAGTASPEPEEAVSTARTRAPARSGSGAKGEVKRLLNEIKLRKMVEDDEGTISLLYELVALEPESSKYEAMLAQALSTHPVMKSKAERHFRRALSIDPQNAQIHYLLGRYYQSFDMKSRALAELKAALAIDPKLSQARSALVEIKGANDGTIQDKLKRLFV